jgi:cystathionine beta-lyase/cystathionine gamma-synthase
MDDLSLPEVRRLVDAAEKNGGFPLKMETKAVHAERGVDPATGAVTPPIHLSTTFERDADGGYPRGYEYTRECNPNRDAPEECVRELEGGAAAAAFSSGMATTMTVLQTLAPGDHVVVPDDTYFGMREIFRDLFSRWGVETSFVDMTNAEEVGGAVRPSTKLFWVETPSNPRLKITDVRGISEIARERAMAVAANVRMFTRATSLGGTHSYVEHRASIEGPGTAAPENLLRLSVGLEHPDDLTEDLARALGRAKH